MRRRHTPLLALALLIALVAGCRSPQAPPVQNLRPGIRLTAGPTSGTTDNYAIPFQWTAWDDDGSVAYFLYAVDRTDSAWTRTENHQETLVFTATAQRDPE